MYMKIVLLVCDIFMLNLYLCLLVESSNLYVFQLTKEQNPLEGASLQQMCNYLRVILFESCFNLVILEFNSLH